MTHSSGNWQTISSGKVWTLKISINNALNTSLRFGLLTLSSTAKLYILNGDTNVIKGPYTKEILPTQGIFGAFPMDGQSCFLFLHEPTFSNQSQNALTISGVVAGVQTIGDMIPPSATARPSNNCVPSIRCANNWMSTARAVSRWSNGGGRSCSGTLLNNENNDGTSFYYSAQHCLPDNRLDLRFATFQFQFWQSGCNTSIDLPWIEFTGGATLLNEVGYNEGDAVLLRLTNGPGVGDGVTYAGWSRQNNNPSRSQSGIIHHPDAGDMRFTQTRSVRDFLWDGDFWKASYSTGIVEPGSSGAALFNENQQVIGTLSRGLSSCFWSFLGDRYGKFHKGWGGMQPFLSPIQNNQNIGSLSLFPLSISGNTVLSCATGPQDYPVPNLAGCTYTWTVSNNVVIQSGQNTNKIRIFYSGSNQAVDIATLNVVINDSKGTLAGRRVSLNLDVYTGGSITGTVMQNGFSNKSLSTVTNIRPNILSTTEFTSFGCTSTTATFIIGTPTSWNFSNNGNFGYLFVTLANGQSANFDITTFNSSCGLLRRRITYVGSTSSWRFIANPNPASDLITVEPVIEVSNILKTNKTVGDLEYLVTIIDFNNGKTVKQQKVKKGQMKCQLDVSKLRKGHYVLQIKEGVNTTSFHVILK